MSAPSREPAAQLLAELKDCVSAYLEYGDACADWDVTKAEKIVAAALASAKSSALDEYFRFVEDETGHPLGGDLRALFNEQKRKWAKAARKAVAP